MRCGPETGGCEVCEEGEEEVDAWGGVGVYDGGAELVEGGIPLVEAFVEPWNSVSVLVRQRKCGERGR